MTEHPILFNGEMVRAIQEGRKFQTRRVVKPQPEREPAGVWEVWKCHGKNGPDTWGACGVGLGASENDHTGLWAFAKDAASIGTPRHCPYGVPGDELWVRETWRASMSYDRRRPADIPQNGGPASGGRNFSPQPICYGADGHQTGIASLGFVLGKWRPSIHMPRWASRITLEVTDVRVERVASISDADCYAEGLPEECPEFDAAEHAAIGGVRIAAGSSERHWFSVLWNRINARRGFGWDVNPWVFVVTFRRKP